MRIIMVSVPGKDKITNDIQNKHIAYAKSCFASMKEFILIGSLMDDSGGGTYIFDTEDDALIRSYIDNDPFNQEGIAEYQVIPYLIRHSKFSSTIGLEEFNL